LLRDGLSGEETFSDTDATTLARCAGAVDFARLDADITGAAARIRGWYRRLIEEPARRAARQMAEHTGDSAA
jgi:glutathione S-transferase